jgi:hypothetical protein
MTDKLMADKHLSDKQLVNKLRADKHLADKKPANTWQKSI